MKKTLLSGKVIGVLLVVSLVVPLVGQAAPSVESVTLDPVYPRRFATIDFSAEVIDEETIESVWILVKECNRTQGVCFPDSFNESMINIDGLSTYEATITLRHDQTSYLTYQVLVQSCGLWYKSIETEVDLNLSLPAVPPNDNDTPGFELPLVFLAVFIGLLMITRKRW